MKKYIPTILVCISLIMSLSSIMAQSFIYNESNTRKQIPTSYIKQVFHDSEGFIWYATTGSGICRDDGYRIDIFRNDMNHSALIGTNNDVSDIVEDKKGNIIFSTFRGVYYLDKGTYTIHIFDKQLIGVDARSLYCDSQGNIWISYTGTVYKYDTSYQCVGKYPIQAGNERRIITMFAEDDDQTIWGISWQGDIYKYNKGQKTLLRHLQTNHNFYSMEWDKSSQCMWIGSWGEGVYLYDRDKTMVQQVQTSGDEHESKIMHIKHDVDRNLVWVLSVINISVYQKGTDKQLHKLELPHNLSSSLIYANRTSIDRYKNVWIASMAPQTFVLSSVPTNMERQVYHTNNTNQSINYATTDDKYTWILTERSGIMAFQKGKSPTIIDNNPESRQLQFTSGNIVKCNKKTTNESSGIWMGNNNRLVHLWIDKNEKIQWYSAGEIKEFKINKIFDDALRKTVYVGGEKYMYAYNYETKEFTLLSDTIFGFTNSIAVTHDGDVYAATELKGLVHLSHKNETWEQSAIQSESHINSICVDTDDILYLAYNNGHVKSYNPRTKEFRLIKAASNQNGDAIKDICMDYLGHLWIVSDLYFKEFNPQTNAYKIYRCSDKEIDMDYFTSLYTDNKYIYINGSNAMLKMSPNTELNQQTASVIPRISTIEIDDSLVWVGKQCNNIKIEPNNANVVFHFTTLDHLHTNNISYRCRLKGYDKQWHFIPEGSNTVNYVNLPKGNYTLELYATDLYGRWSNEAITFQVVRLPAWWETWWAYTIYILTIAAIAIITLRTYLNRQQERRQTEMERELTELKFRFFTNISHEIRTPLTLIITPLESLINGLTTTKHVDSQFADKAAGLLPGIYNNACELKELISRLLDFRKLEMGQQQLYLSNGDICDFLRAACEAFRPTTQQRGIALGCTVPDTPLYIKFDKDKLHHIIYNLLSNAVKFTSEGGSINITGNIQNNRLNITVSDTGCGINKEAQQHIFDRFYQVERSSDTTPAGTGIGLHMVKEYVTMMQGIITVESVPNKGTNFHVSIPIETTSEKKEEQSENHIDELIKEQPTLLLVDDTHEFIDFLKLELSGKYNILTAGNGQEALDKLNQNEHNIDIVLTDVMMPVMDGMELCRKIKSDMNLSHTLVMLLTAKSAEEAKLEGYKAGADAFISKPFNLELLFVRLQHLLDQRQARYQAYQQSDKPIAEEVTMNEIDKQFMEKMISFVETHMENSDYGPQELTEDMCMSRSTLYRKISSLTGEKPTEFVRNIRLKHAARLIKSGQYTITEVGYMSGFSSQSYFSRCFKEYFGVSATAYK